MYIEKIVLRNFKSFGKKTEIPFCNGFTVITGPNGSGKSNVIDSILFCLGLSTSSKQLRAERLTDLIHNGKKDAEVSVVFSDNGKRYEITRKVKITDKGYYSYYYLNGKSKNLSDIHKFLSHYGILNYAYNMVMQGDVTRIIEMSPFQRRKIIDDVAGISEFDEKKERALEELETVRENIEKLELVISEIASRLSKLEKDREEALKYKNLLKEKEEFENYLTLHEYFSILNSLKKVKRELAKFDRQKDELTQKIPSLNKKIEFYNGELEKIVQKINELGDEKISELQSKILEYSSNLESLRKSREFYLDEIKRIESEILKIRSGLSKINDELESINDEIKENVLKRMNVAEIVESLSREVESLKLRLQEVDREYQEVKSQLVEKKEKVEELREEKSNLLRERDKIIEVLRRIEIEIDEILAENDSLEKARADLEREINEKVNEVSKMESETDKIRRKIRELDNKLFSIRSELSELDSEIRNAELELAKVRGKLATIKTYSKPVEFLLNAKRRKEISGIFGTVAELGDVEERFLDAIEAAAGSSLQFLVVETEDDAVTAIKYLKERRGGRATFIPLRKIKRFKLNLDKSILRERGVIDYAVNLIQCDRKFSPVFRFILRDTVVVDTIDTARRLMHRDLRMVTLDGDLVEKSGLISGGSKERGGILLSKELIQKESELEEKLLGLKRRREELIGELNETTEIKREKEADLEKIKHMVDEIMKSIDLTRERISNVQRRIKENEARIKQREIEGGEKKKVLALLTEKINRIESEINSYLSEISEIEKKIGKSEIPRIMSEIEEKNDEYSRNREILLTIDKKLENLENIRERILKELNEKENILKELESRKSELANSVNECDIEISKIQLELGKLKEEERHLGKELKELRRKRDEILAELRRCEDEKRGIEFQMDKIQEKIENLEEKKEILSQSLLSFGEVSVEQKDLPPIDYVRRRLEELNDELSEFGDVNLKAITEFEEVKRRRDDLLEKKIVLEREREDIIERIRRYEKRKREVFFEVFNAVCKNFSGIIRELTDGEGELYLDSDDPFNSGLHIKFKPKSKSYLKLESMSGGEKSLVALALIFAIQMYKPAPFYAFDEVDMFLDGVNVGKVAKMIKKRSSEAQFIVVSLRKPMLECADAVVGVTLGRDHSSQVTGIKLRV